MDTKKCSKCKQEKPLTEFSKDKSRKGGFYCWCKQCSNVQHKELYRKNKEIILIRQKKYYSENKELVSQRCKKYRQENKTKIRNMRRKYEREHLLGTTNGTYIGINKRPYPEPKRCELCGHYAKKLSYHHYEKERVFERGDFIAGIWLCWGCHYLAHQIEDRTLEVKISRYEQLKKELMETHA